MPATSTSTTISLKSDRCCYLQPHRTDTTTRVIIIIMLLIRLKMYGNIGFEIEVTWSTPHRRSKSNRKVIAFGKLSNVKSCVLMNFFICTYFENYILFIVLIFIL